MKKSELKNGMAVIVKMSHGTFSDRVIDVDQAHGVWCERCHLVAEGQIYPATIESEHEIDRYDAGADEMVYAGMTLINSLVEPKFI